MPKNVDVSKIQKITDIQTPVVGPINVGDKVGSLNFVYEDNVIYSIDLLSDNKIDTIDEAKLERKEKMKDISKVILNILKYLLIGVVIFVIAFFTLAFIVRNIVKYRRRRKRRNRYRYNSKPLKPIKKSNRRKNYLK